MQHAQHDSNCWRRKGAYEKFLYNSSDNKLYFWEVNGEQGRMARFIQRQMNQDIKEGREPSKFASYIRSQYDDEAWKDMLSKREH